MGLRNRTLYSKHSVRFVTTTFVDWINMLKDDSFFQVIINSIEFVNKKYAVKIMGYVLMPNHIHLLLFLNEPEKLSDYMRDFKKFTSGELRRKIIAEQHLDILTLLEKHKTPKGYKIWKDRFDDVALRTSEAAITKLNYIHQNPVRKLLSATAPEYKYSSAGFYATGEKGVLEVTHYLDAMGWANHYAYGRIYQ